MQQCELDNILRIINLKIINFIMQAD